MNINRIYFEWGDFIIHINRKSSLFIELALLLILVAAGSMVMVAAPPALAAGSTVRTTYSDVKADNPNQVFMAYLYHRGIMTGFPDGTFHPDEGLTRAQAAVVIDKAAGLTVPADVASSFQDVPDSHWALKYIVAAEKAGYLKGFSDGTFRPDEKLTRAQGVSLIMRLCKQSERAGLPVLKDMNASHWAARDVGTAISLEMIGTSADGKYVYPEANMTRAVLARALAILLTTDPGLNQTVLVGNISEIKGEISLTRNARTIALATDSDLLKGDVIQSGKDSTAKITYPDGSSTLIEENTQVVVKESIGRNYIKQDGTPSVAIDLLDLELKEGILYGALAAKRGEEEKPEGTQTSSTESRLLASRNGLMQLAAAEAGSAQPWYKTAQKKKVKVQVDMPWGIAAIRGTFFKVTVNQDGSCKVSCLTGNADVRSSQGSVPLGDNQSSSITGKGSGPTAAGDMGTDEVAGFSQQQKWVVDAALQMDMNQEAPVVQMIVDVTGSETSEGTEENAATALGTILDALEASGIQLTPDVIQQLQQQLQQMPANIYEDEELQDQIDDDQEDTSEHDSVRSGPDSHVEVLVYNQAGTYGPADTSSRLSAGDVIVNASGVTLQNMQIAGSVTINNPSCCLHNVIVEGNLTLGEGVGEGDVTLTETAVHASTMIYGGGSASVHLVDSCLATVFVSKTGNTIRITAEGNTEVGSLTLNSGAILEESGLTGTGFSSVITTSHFTAGCEIILIGNFGTLDVNVPGLTITLQSGTIQNVNILPVAAGTELVLSGSSSVQTLNARAAATITGSGRVTNAVIYAAGVVMEQIPLNWTIRAGISADLGGQVITGTGSASNACDILTVNSPAGAILSPGSVSAAVDYDTTEVTIDVTVSTDAAWIMYADSGCTSEIVNKIMTLSVGSNVAYIKVIAQDNVTYQIYLVNITRNHSSACTVATVGTAYTVDDTGNTIVADSITINTNLTVDSFLANLTKHEEASWKAVTSATSVATSAEFAAATAKAGTATLIFGDKLAVMAGDGTIKVYVITVVLGNPVQGISSWPPTPSGKKSPTCPFTWGKYRYVLYDDDSNPWAWFNIIAFDENNVARTPYWQMNGGRYVTGLTIDYANQTFVITCGQYSNGGYPIVVPWSNVQLAQP